MKFLISSFTILLLLVLFFSFIKTGGDPIEEFIEGLDKDQKVRITYPIDDVYRERWHYLPAASWVRPGISLKEMSDKQKQLAHKLLQYYLSESGYDKTLQIIDLENVLAELENDNIRRDPEKYFISIYGDPKDDLVWSWRFEGHHVSLHFTTVDGEISMSPRFFGANPAIVKEGSRKGLKTLYTEESLGLQLINSMTDAQKQKAIIRDVAYWEVVTSNAVEVAPFKDKGIMVGELNSGQQKLVWEIIDEFISTVPSDLARKRKEKIENEEKMEISFAWTGGLELGKAHYYRIQGNSFLIEFDNAQNDANHIHVVWRDFDGDFGRDLMKEHYLKHKH